MFTKEARVSSLAKRARITRLCISAVGGTKNWKALSATERKKKHVEIKASLDAKAKA